MLFPFMPGISGGHRNPSDHSDILVGVTPKTAAVGSIITAKEETEIKKCILFC